MTNVIGGATNGITLLPCPFCGGGAYVSELRDGMWRAICKSCNASGNNYMTEAEAVNAWNTRTANRLSGNRTCYNKKEAYTRFFGYYFVCSECGWNIPDVGNDGIELAVALMKSCPMCGAKVVD